MSVMLDLDLYTLIFEKILQLKQCMGTAGWGCWVGPENFAHDFIYALFLPHVVLLVFIYLIGTTTFIFRAHRGLGALFGIAAYIFIIYSGWYAILASWLVFWLALTIFISLGYFFLSKIIHPSEGKERFALGAKIGESIKASGDKDNAVRELVRYRNELENMRRGYERQRNGAQGDEKVKLGEKVREIEVKITEVNREIRKVRNG